MVGKGGSFMLQNDSSLAAIILSLGWAGTLLTGASFLLLTAAACRLKTKSPGPAQVIKMLFLVLLSRITLRQYCEWAGGFFSLLVMGLALALAAAKAPGHYVKAEPLRESYA